MSGSGDRDGPERLKKSLQNLGGQLKRLAKAGVRWAYWKSGAALDDPMLEKAVDQGYVMGTKRSRPWWTTSPNREKKPGEDLPS